MTGALSNRLDYDPNLVRARLLGLVNEAERLLAVADDLAAQTGEARARAVSLVAQAMGLRDRLVSDGEPLE